MSQRKAVRTMIMAVGACAMSACATINGTTQEIKVDSSPQGAQIFTGVRSDKTGGQVQKRTTAGVTPATVTISRKDGVIQLEKAGYEPAEVSLKTTMNPWMWGDI
ncbi:MAG TPA: hypothetical protein VJM11_20515, partial [Nevskiaceae bacterium]|nr:hypothetical protein [Nevskiaceae bacterium]